MPQGQGTYGSKVGRPPKKTSVGLSKVGGDFAVGRKQAKELKKKRRKNKKSKLSLKQKILKALKISTKGARGVLAKGAGGILALGGELAVPDQLGAPTLPKGYHSWSPKKKAQYVNSLRRK